MSMFLICASYLPNPDPQVWRVLIPDSVKESADQGDSLDAMIQDGEE